MNIPKYEAALKAALDGGMLADEAHEFATDQATRNPNPAPAPNASEYEELDQMTRPVPMVRKDHSEGTLIYATYETLPCGCKVTGNGSLQHPLTVRYCPTHTAAHDLLAALEACEAALASFCPYHSARPQARSAITLAKGQL